MQTTTRSGTQSVSVKVDVEPKMRDGVILRANVYGFTELSLQVHALARALRRHIDSGSARQGGCAA